MLGKLVGGTNMYKYGFISILSILCVLLMGTYTASAERLPESEKIIETTTTNMNTENMNFDPYSGKYIGDVYKVKNGILEKVDFQEYLNEMERSNENVKLSEQMQKNNATELLNDISPMEVNYKWFEFEKTGQYIFYSGYEKASATIFCPSGTINCSIAQQYSLTKTQSWNIGLGIDLLKKVKSNAGFTWQDSATVSSTFTFTLNPGTKGYVAFNPRHNQVLGWAKTYDSMRGLISKDWVDARSPIKLNNGQLEGYVTFMFE